MSHQLLRHAERRESRCGRSNSSAGRMCARPEDMACIARCFLWAARCTYRKNCSAQAGDSLFCSLIRPSPFRHTPWIRRAGRTCRARAQTPPDWRSRSASIPTACGGALPKGTSTWCAAHVCCPAPDGSPIS